MKNKNRRVDSKGRLKPDGKLNPADYFNLTKEWERAFRKAAFEEEQQKKKDFHVGGVIEIGEARMSLKLVRSLLSLPA